MTRWLMVASLAVTGLVVGSEAARAQVIVQAPFVNVQVGPGGVYVRAPFVTVDVKKFHPLPVLVGPAPGEALPAPGVVVPMPLLPAARPMSVRDFASSFRPTAGMHQAVMMHPVTGQPVSVDFRLPPGTPEVRSTDRQIEFDYGREEVEVRFASNGTVKVTYND